MAEHPIQGLMQTAMENIKDMVDVNTIVGTPVETQDGSVILPISRVNFGFAAGGSDIGNEEQKDRQAATPASNMPFGGGSGGGVSITPMAFLVVGQGTVKVVSVDHQTHLWERLIDQTPQVVEKIQSFFQTSAQPQPEQPPQH